MLTKMLTLALLVSACGNSEGQSSSPKAQGDATLRAIRIDNKDFPYIQYPEVTGKKESRGRVFFLYPITDLKTRLSAMEYTPGMHLEKLFAEDMSGISGLVIQTGNQIRVEFLPVSVPIGIAIGQEWRIKYAKQEFLCKSAAPSDEQEQTGRIEIACTGEKHTFKFLFHREAGVTEYQDFCNFSVCTYRLASPHGLLSRAMTDFMGLPPL